MVIYELLVHSKPLPIEQTTEDVGRLPTPAATVNRSAPKAPRKPVAQKPVVGSVLRFITENVSRRKVPRLKCGRGEGVPVREVPTLRQIKDYWKAQASSLAAREKTDN